jgi:DNA invertase Pin-like site-specific DNA recombinase
MHETHDQQQRVPQWERQGKVQDIHLDRLAVVYVRQSTLQQVQHHQESGRLQYALKERAIQLGWTPRQVLVIDEDQGQSATRAESRAGFQHLVAEVGLNHVGLVLGIEMSRLARSNSDWHRLIEMCALYQTLIGDGDGIYDPRSYNDRLLLGLKGTMSEAELHILKHRLDAGKWAKARRGELRIPVPMGYMYSPSGKVMKDPDEQAQSVIELVFATFERYRSVAGVLRYLLAQKIQLPVRERKGPAKGRLRWSRPHLSTLRQLLHNPTYTGAYVYGRQRVDPAKQQPGHPGSGRPRVPMDEWTVCLKDRLPAYITWQHYERNVRQIAANTNLPQGIGAVRQGPSLLAGLVVCGRCGKRMFTLYSHNGRGLCYVCQRRYLRYQDGFCQTVCGRPIDEAVSRVVLQALEPLALELSLKVREDVERARIRLLEQWQQRLERARYEVDRAFRQYNAVDPEHRLVARQLERQWEAALQAEAALTNEYERLVSQQPVPLLPEERETIQRLAEDIPALWHAPTTTTTDRQAIIRQLIDRVVLTVGGTSEKVALDVLWKGGHHTQMTAIRRVASLKQLSYYQDLVDRVAELRAGGQSLPMIARILTEEGWRSTKGTGPLTVSTVRRCLPPVKTGHTIARRRFSEEIAKEAHEWTVNEFTERLDMPRETLYMWIKTRKVNARRVRHHGQWLWLIWADEVEFARLRDHRKSSCARSSRLWNPKSHNKEA